MTDNGATSEAFAEKHGINVERFWSKVDKSAGEDGCWLWTGAKTTGYGVMCVRRKLMLAHRIAFGLDTGQEPDAVCHKCDVRPCCNPAHLFGGTRADNNRDMTAKGRHAAHIGTHHVPSGEAHYRAKLTSAQVAEVRRRLLAGEHQRVIAKEFGVSQSTAWRIKTGWSRKNG